MVALHPLPRTSTQVKIIENSGIEASKTSLEIWMNHLSVGDAAPDFTLPDHTGTLFRLGDVYRSQYVLLVFNIGFA